MARIQSPLTVLLRTWWTQPPLKVKDLNARRAELFRTAADEIEHCSRQGLIYDPLADNRFQWAVQRLDVVNGTRVRIDLGVRDSAEFLLGFTDPHQDSAKHHAAGDSAAA